ncbi:MAG: hypothetical protein K6A14_05910, partial [Erysipelotrichaceae bacterium]|nr:hypothetical protein [Erysipelotrichaceae bacterium]
YPMLHETSVIASDVKFELSSVGEPLRKAVIDGAVSFEKAIRYLRNEYALWGVRAYGDVSFDLLAIYDVLDPDAILSLALSGAKKKALFITEAILEEIRQGNAFLAETVRYAANFCCCVAVTDEKLTPAAAAVLPESIGKNLSVISSVESLSELISNI